MTNSFREEALRHLPYSLWSCFWNLFIYVFSISDCLSFKEHWFVGVFVFCLWAASWDIKKHINFSDFYLKLSGMFALRSYLVSFFLSFTSLFLNQLLPASYLNPPYCLTSSCCLPTPEYEEAGQLCKDYAHTKGPGTHAKPEKHQFFRRLAPIVARTLEKCERENGMM